MTPRQDPDRSNQIGIFGLSFDGKSSFLKGAASAPPLIRQNLYSDASNTFAENGLDIRHNLISDRGDASVGKYEEIEPLVEAQLCSSARLFILGGDHSITYPVLKAYAKHYSGIQILLIDAHADLYDNLDGDRHSHACPFARIMEERLAVRLLQVGIRTLNDHQREQARRFGVEILEMKDFYPGRVPQLEGPVYLSLDLDGLDPAHAPGVSHQEPGGLTTRDVIGIIQAIEAPLIGADLVEYNPSRDINGMTATLAAKLMKEILSKMLEQTI